MNPFLLRFAIGIGVAVVSGVAAWFLYNNEQQRETPHGSGGYSYERDEDDYSFHRHTYDTAGSQRQDFEQKDLNCSICLGKLCSRKDISLLQCGHKYHTHCIQSWTFEQNTCPQCRKPMVFL